MDRGTPRRRCLVVSIHDLGLGCLDADLVIDGSVTKNARARNGLTLAGPKYAVLDPSLHDEDERRDPYSVLVALGGGPRAELANDIAEAIVDANPHARVRIAGGFWDRRRRLGGRSRGSGRLEIFTRRWRAPASPLSAAASRSTKRAHTASPRLACRSSPRSVRPSRHSSHVVRRGSRVDLSLRIGCGRMCRTADGRGHAPAHGAYGQRLIDGRGAFRAAAAVGGGRRGSGGAAGGPDRCRHRLRSRRHALSARAARAQRIQRRRAVDRHFDLPANDVYATAAGGRRGDSRHRAAGLCEVLSARCGARARSGPQISAVISRSSGSRTMPAALCALRARGWRTALLTNGDPSVQAAKVRALGLHELVDHVLYADEHAPGGKPPRNRFSPRSVLEVAPQNAVMVGDDRINDIEGARAVGMRTILLARRGARTRRSRRRRTGADRPAAGRHGESRAKDGSCCVTSADARSVHPRSS